jgi:hypothetical protein
LDLCRALVLFANRNFDNQCTPNAFQITTTFPGYSSHISLNLLFELCDCHECSIRKLFEGNPEEKWDGIS